MTQRLKEKSAPGRGGESEPFDSSFCLFFPSPWSCPMQLGLTRFALLPEVVTPVLRPSFVLFSWAVPFLVFSVQFSSVAQSCPTLCDPMNRTTPGLHVHHHLPEFTQTHVHRVRDAIQPSHPLSSPSPPAPNPSQHQSLFQ